MVKPSCGLMPGGGMVTDEESSFPFAKLKARRYLS